MSVTKEQKDTVLHFLNGFQCDEYEVAALAVESKKMTFRTKLRSSHVLGILHYFWELIEKEPHHVYIRPDTTSVILVDDLSLNDARRLWKDGLQPSVLVETSPDNYQAWVRVATEPISQNLATAIGKVLAEKYDGDRGSSDYRHLGRFPTFPNMKIIYQDKRTGEYPISKLIHSEYRVVSKPEEILSEAEKILTEVNNDTPNDVPEIFKQLSGKFKLRPGLDAGVYADLLYQVKLIELDNPDMSSVDFFVAIKLIERGFSYSDIYEALECKSSELKERKKGHIKDYLKRTIKKAAETVFNKVIKN